MLDKRAREIKASRCIFRVEIRKSLPRSSKILRKVAQEVVTELPDVASKPFQNSMMEICILDSMYRV